MRVDRQLLVPIDGSKNSVRALDFAIELAEILEGSITLIHVLERTYEDEVIASKRMLRLMKERVAKKNVKVSAICRKGVPWEQIVREAKGGYHMVIVGSMGHSGIKRILLGSVAEAVARESPIPVTIVR